MNGNFLGIGADLAINASVQVDASQAPGILITNGEFTAFTNGQWLPGGGAIESSHVVTAPSNKGPVKFVDSSFWGPASQVALLQGSGTVTFSGCEFVQWDEQKKDGRAAIRAEAGSLMVQGSTFAQAKRQVELGRSVKKAVIVGNVITGGENVVVASSTTVVEKGLNACDATEA
jgi:pectin methylesterase-like acyl-CoA thioesterase